MTETGRLRRVDFEAGERVRAKPAPILTSDGRADRFCSVFHPVSSLFQRSMSILPIRANFEILRNSTGYKSQKRRKTRLFLRATTAKRKEC